MGDAGLAHFKDCKNLHGSRPVRHASDRRGAGPLQGLQEPEGPSILVDTQVGDAGLANFKDCKNLTQLNLINTQVGDAGLAYFKDCKNLTDLNLAARK